MSQRAVARVWVAPTDSRFFALLTHPARYPFDRAKHSKGHRVHWAQLHDWESIRPRLRQLADLARQRVPRPAAAGFSWILDGFTLPGNHDDPPDYTAPQMRLEERQQGAVSMLLVRQSCIAHYTSFFHGGHASFRSENERARAIRRSLRINVTLSALQKWCEFRNTLYEDVYRNSDAPIVLSYESITTAPKLLDRVLDVLNVRSPRPPESSMVKMVKMHSAPLH